MNAIDARVVRVTSKPKRITGSSAWYVECRVTAYGTESAHSAIFQSKKEADEFKVGDTVTI